MLSVDKINAGYGQTQVLFDVSLNVKEHEVVGIIGPNGHGKSTILRTISGLIHPISGSIKFNGEEISKLPPYLIVKRGITHISESGNLFENMTVEENIKVGAYNLNAWKKRSERIKEVYDLFPQLKKLKSRKAWSLSGGEKRMLAFGRGFMASSKLIAIDEPSLGLAPQIIEELYEKIKELIKSGISFFISEQNIDYLSEIAERLYLVEKGRIALEGEREEVLAKKHVVKTYLGL